MTNSKGNIKYTVLQNHDRGSSLKLTFSVTNVWSASDIRGHIDTEIYNLDSVLIRMRFLQYVPSNYQPSYKCLPAADFPVILMISTKLSPNPSLNCKRLPFALSKDHSVEMVITTELGNFGKKIDTDDWTNYFTICQKTGNVHDSVLTVSPIDVLLVINKREAVSFANLYDDDELTDFHLSTPTTDKIAVHKACLAAHSDVFKAMLSKEWKETVKGQLNIPGATLKTLEHLKKYIYLGSLPDDSDMLQQLLVFASCYMMEALKTECISELTFQVTSENLHNTLRFACENNVPDLVISILEKTPDNVIKEAHKQALEETNSDAKEPSDDGIGPKNLE